MKSAEEIAVRIESITDKPSFDWKFISWNTKIISWLREWQEEIREDQRKKCAKGVENWIVNQTPTTNPDPETLEQAILNAGKEEKEDE